MTAAVLGIVITVVSLLVQLTAERSTGVAQMFLRGRRNVVVMAYYVVTCVVGVAISLSLHDELVPRAAVFSMMCATASGPITIREQLARVESKKYREIIDRRRNFDDMPPRQKEQMDRFFAMLDHDAVR